MINIRQQLKAKGLRANKKLGQNFLIDDFHLKSIVEKSLASQDELVLEIGAGLGSLTIELAQRAKHVFSIEIDRGIFLLLEENLKAFDNVSLIHGDILKMDLSQIMPAQAYNVVANIPYYLTSKLIRQLMEAESGPEKISLLVQKEVAERASQSAPKMNLLALNIQLFGRADIIHNIPASAFFPVPKVDSALLQVTKHASVRLDKAETREVFRLARIAYQQKRKTLANSLASLPDWDKEAISEILIKAEIEPNQRPQTLELGDWKRLAKITKPR